MSRFQWFFLYYLIILNWYDMKTLSFPILVIMILMCFPNHLPAQEIPKIRPVFGIRYTANYFSIPSGNSLDYYRVLSSIPSVFVEFNKHFDLHIGMVYAHLFNPHWVDLVYYNPNAFGLSYGSRFTIIELNKNLRIQGQIDGSIANIRFRNGNSHQQVFGLVADMRWALSFSFGLDYQLTNKIGLTAGPSVGIASGRSAGITSGRSDFFISPFLGIDYRF